MHRKHAITKSGPAINEVPFCETVPVATSSVQCYMIPTIKQLDKLLSINLLTILLINTLPNKYRANVELTSFFLNNSAKIFAVGNVY